eukprot:TRINITY_DN11_c0_g1_i7.p1 TRINITY_DN11_c0_g1~~TRINITY_DN11_c0_g1_i7.p1  ORF type:complete len:202 (+),score=56.39 TRINITY_DN11_c0_g1_i7:103-708(+)
MSIFTKFYHGTVEVSGFTTEIAYYTNEEFTSWQGNNNEYADQAKDYLVEKAAELEYTTPLTKAMLKDNTALNWDTFESDYWQSDNTTENYDENTSLFYLFASESFHSLVASSNTILFPNRRCEQTDYSSYYRELNGVDIPDVPPPFCNVDAYNEKPRTHMYPAKTSLFPMQTRTRVEALSRSNSAYFYIDYCCSMGGFNDL